jgi:hypothetical protein
MNIINKIRQNIFSVSGMYLISSDNTTISAGGIHYACNEIGIKPTQKFGGLYLPNYIKEIEEDIKLLGGQFADYEYYASPIPPDKKLIRKLKKYTGCLDEEY